MSKFATHATWVVGVLGMLGSGVAGSLVTQYIQKEDYAVSAMSCSHPDPKMAYLEHVETGRRAEISVDKIPLVPLQLYRVTKITNVGNKTINDEELHIDIVNNVNATLWQTMIFFESPLSRHEFLTIEDGKAFKIMLKTFNPHDTISVVVISDRQIGTTVMSKGFGFTLFSVFKKERCSPTAYGGKLAYSKVDERCTLNPKTLSLSCAYGNIGIKPPFPDPHCADLDAAPGRRGGRITFPAGIAPHRDRHLS